MLTSPSPLRDVYVEAPSAGRADMGRPSVKGKFLWVGNRKLYIRGVTYGPFSGPGSPAEYGDRNLVEQDLSAMAAFGINAIRTYSVPPIWLLDAALKHDLWVMVGLPWEQHVTFLDHRRSRRAIERRIRAGVRVCAGHPAVLSYAVGNEIPASIVRWHGRRRVERFLERMIDAARDEDPEGLFTYANYPSTEYLEPRSMDIVTFNVYLEDACSLDAYLARVQNLAGDLPVILGEIGLDSRRNGEAAQAEILRREILTAFGGGCAGAFVFAWTDNWHRGGHDIVDWSFGLTSRDRRPRPALAAVAEAYADVPIAPAASPRISVVVCSLNGARTIQECLAALRRLRYPNFEVIVVNDGSTDETEAIARSYGFRVITTAKQGLSSARNVGLREADGEIVAYIDDDAYPDADWLGYLATAMLTSTHVGVGGPNISPPGDGAIADSVALAPGGPIHVLLSDREAEHLPGCNMAFRRDALLAIGGFDPQFRAAGDDVDICWRIQDRGWTLGFCPSAVVWHHRRRSIRGYWRQQRGYGKAEALLERKWPERYNRAGHLSWAGRVYGGPSSGRASRRSRVYQGVWGTAPFQSIQPSARSKLRSLTAMPEWYLGMVCLGVLSALGALWHPLLLAVPLYLAVLLATVTQAALNAGRAVAGTAGPGYTGPVRWSLTTLLHLMQPLARLAGRLRHGLTPWRARGLRSWALPIGSVDAVWRERWRSPTETLERLESSLRSSGAVVVRGGAYDRWDLEVRGGTLGAARLLMTIEEHGGGRQFVRYRSFPHWARGWRVGLAGLFGLSVAALAGRAWLAGAILVAGWLLAAAAMLRQCGAALGTARSAVKETQ